MTPKSRNNHPGMPPTRIKIVFTVDGIGRALSGPIGDAFLRAMNLTPTALTTPESGLPFDVYAERALIGVLLYNNAALEDVSDALKHQHFSETINAKLFHAIGRHVQNGMLAEPILLAEEFSHDQEFLEAGGLGYLLAPVDGAPEVEDAAIFARRIYFAAWDAMHPSRLR